MTWSMVDVSRETSDRLGDFANLVRKWSPSINLVAKSSLPDLEDRHINDSLQIVLTRTQPGRSWVDLGSGGGFPGIVAAIIAIEHWPETHTTLVESDQRKATFLRTCIRELGLRASVNSNRIEALDPMGATTLSARALSDLDRLLAFAERHLAPDGMALFAKGATWQKEVDNAKSRWRFSYTAHTSELDPQAAILEIGEIARV